eukprot:TRINITY_DN9565_c0_g1_i10.p2 TRINITY_DN9565_c0_g1~~TRINITY_DN9565_c0_g1_i10.p2  ORF type:complete len:101 (+),score=7.29 TRINITY_DN9565_c0_g1_i10:131-433(+)
MVRVYHKVGPTMLSLTIMRMNISHHHHHHHHQSLAPTNKILVIIQKKNICRLLSMPAHHSEQHDNSAFRFQIAEDKFHLPFILVVSYFGAKNKCREKVSA